jgi:hypothetical protein
MTTQKLFKRRVRERMAKTGERYATARTHVERQRQRPTATRVVADTLATTLDLAAALDLASDEKLVEATGKGWLAWIAILDAWGAQEQTHPATVTYLANEHAAPAWWRQTITVGYQRVRGMRRKHQQADGYSVYASRTIGVPVERLFAAFVDDEIRARWLEDGTMTGRGAQPTRVARFDWEGGPTRVMVTFDAKGPAKATAYVTHERLPDPEAGEAAKAAWKDRLAALKRFLEAPA